MKILGVTSRLQEYEQLSCVAIGECMLELSGAPGNCQLGFGGDTLNTAIYMARLGAEVEYLTALGDDSFSQQMLDAWQWEGVGVSLVQRVKGRLPGLYIIETDDAGERFFHYWRDASPAREIFDGPSREPLFERLSQFEYLYLSGITLSLYSEESQEYLLDFLTRYAREGGKLVFDSNFRPRGWKTAAIAREIFDRTLALCHMALPSLEDEQLLRPGVNAKEVMGLHQAMGVQEVVIKCGPDGCLAWSQKNGIYRQQGEPVSAVDTTAAGDSFNGAYLASRMLGANIQSAAETAHKVASTVVQYPGAIIPRDSVVI
ncbi:MAG: sugar kinase [Halioglobus sp.]|nr:sugar kinase [Halioglobus sp.]